jgi:hypothetical protein
VRAVVGGDERAAERGDHKCCDELLRPIEQEIDRILTTLNNTVVAMNSIRGRFALELSVDRCCASCCCRAFSQVK